MDGKALNSSVIYKGEKMQIYNLPPNSHNPITFFKTYWKPILDSHKDCLFPFYPFERKPVCFVLTNKSLTKYAPISDQKGMILHEIASIRTKQLKEVIITDPEDKIHKLFKSFGFLHHCRILDYNIVFDNYLVCKNALKRCYSMLERRDDIAVLTMVNMFLKQLGFQMRNFKHKFIPPFGIGTTNVHHQHSVSVISMLNASVFIDIPNREINYKNKTVEKLFRYHLKPLCTYFEMIADV